MKRGTRGLVYAVTLLVCCGWLLPAEALAKKTILRLRLNGPVTEAPSDAAGLMALLAEEEFNTLRGWVKMIERAAEDSKIDGLVLIIESPQIGFAQTEELAEAVQYFKAKGKPVLCYLDYAGNLTYALAAAADNITIAENSIVSIVGLHAEMMYFKGLLDKIGVETQAMHCGAYKSAMEPFTRTEPSEEAAQNVNWLLDGLYQRWVEMIAESRDLSADEVKQIVDQAPLMAQEALEHKLVDQVSSFSAFKELVYSRFGKDVEVLKKYGQGTGLEIDMDNPFWPFELISRIAEGTGQSDKAGLGLIYIDGLIVVGSSDDNPLMGSIAGSNTIRAAFEDARDDERVKAVVVRIDSPGGSALASDIIWKAATRCAEEKPVIVSMGSVAGSGGYYVAVPGNTIFADATTLTGSIGVVGGKFVWRDLMQNKLGITTTEYSRGAHAGFDSMNRKWDQSELKWLETFLNKTYDQFKDRVRASRGERLKGNLDEMAGGRVFTGQQALEHGLIDRIGGLSDAISFAARKAYLGAEYEVYVFPRPSEFQQMLNLLQKLMGDDGKDEFEIGHEARLATDPLVRTALPLLRGLAPAQFRELVRGLRNLVILQHERVGCFMPFVPQVR